MNFFKFQIEKEARESRRVPGDPKIVLEFSSQVFYILYLSNQHSLVIQRAKIKVVFE